MNSPNYIFRWKHYLFFSKESVTGHKYVEDQNKMILYLPNGGIREIANWSQCECKLGLDWVLAVKEQINSEAGK